jgi:hypothetical protein
MTRIETVFGFGISNIPYNLSGSFLNINPAFGSDFTSADNQIRLLQKFRRQPWIQGPSEKIHRAKHLISDRQLYRDALLIQIRK